MQLAYCDYIAQQIFDNAIPDNQIIESVSSPRYDLHPTGGYFVSTKKTIEMQDQNGKKYKVTVEEVE
jgi:predicted cupin superfamily sugar epimerase|tara:strand:+ start:155 stop:355 length:201 start_codon:yes stop_codon:yes gene_type:complete